MRDRVLESPLTNDLLYGFQKDRKALTYVKWAVIRTPPWSISIRLRWLTE